MRLGGPQLRSGRVQKISSPPGFDPPDRPARTSTTLTQPADCPRVRQVEARRAGGILDYPSVGRRVGGQWRRQEDDQRAWRCLMHTVTALHKYMTRQALGKESYKEDLHFKFSLHFPYQEHHVTRNST